MVTLIIFSLISVYGLFQMGMSLYQKRMEIVNEGNQYSEDIIKSHKKTERTEYLSYYKEFDPLNNHKKVLDRQDNVIVVNFVDHYQQLLKRNKIK